MGPVEGEWQPRDRHHVKLASPGEWFDKRYVLYRSLKNGYTGTVIGLPPRVLEGGSAVRYTCDCWLR
jgi:hypothetical protein